MAHMFARRHYKVIAQAVRIHVSQIPYMFLGNVEEQAAREATTMLVTQIASHLSTENPRFNWEKFVQACGLEDKKK